MRQETGDFLLRHEIFSYGRPTKKILGKLDIILSTVLYCIVLYCTVLYRIILYFTVLFFSFYFIFLLSTIIIIDI